MKKKIYSGSVDEISTYHTPALLTLLCGKVVAGRGFEPLTFGL